SNLSRKLSQLILPELKADEGICTTKPDESLPHHDSQPQEKANPKLSQIRQLADLWRNFFQLVVRELKSVEDGGVRNQKLAQNERKAQLDLIIGQFLVGLPSAVS